MLRDALTDTSAVGSNPKRSLSIDLLAESEYAEWVAVSFGVRLALHIHEFDDWKANTL